MRCKIIILILACLINLFPSEVFARSFKQYQLQYSRFRVAIKEKDSSIKEVFKQRGIQYPPQNIFIRIFKKEQSLELWARSRENDSFTFIKDYKFSGFSGDLGPKREEGDLQIPEGFYHVDRFNPASRFYLSLGINYPNKSDRILGKKGRLGGDIFIHGSFVTIGCIPITTDKIKELYLIAVETKSNGQDKISVHIFPRKLDKQGIDELRKQYRDNQNIISFWMNLKKGFDIFEQTHHLPKVIVNEKGEYIFSQKSN